MVYIEFKANAYTGIGPLNSAAKVLFSHVLAERKLTSNEIRHCLSRILLQKGHSSFYFCLPLRPSTFGSAGLSGFTDTRSSWSRIMGIIITEIISKHNQLMHFCISESRVRMIHKRSGTPWRHPAWTFCIVFVLWARLRSVHLKCTFKDSQAADASLMKACFLSSGAKNHL